MEANRWQVNIMIGKQTDINQDSLGKAQPVKSIRKIEMIFLKHMVMVGGGLNQLPQADTNLNLIKKIENEYKYG